MNLINKIKRYLHTHSHDKLIVSMYWSFETRKCIYECKCGHRTICESRQSRVYPHPTASMITWREFQSYLTMSPVKTEYYYRAYGFNVAYGRKVTQWQYIIDGKELWININGVSEFKAKYPNSKYREIYI